jgi:hypothetical protein
MKNAEVYFLNQDDPFNTILKQFVIKEFPNNFLTGSSDLIDLISDELISTKCLRYGPKPSPESQVAIRNIIRHYTPTNQPIPFLIPWGSEKPDGSGVDIAEISALKTIYNLNERVKHHYHPGFIFNIRIEDVSAPHLFNEDMQKARDNAELYSSGLVNLIKVFGLDHIIKGIRESTLIDEPTFNSTADSIIPYMEKYLIALFENDMVSAELAFDNLQSQGWKGAISKDTRQYYMDRYTKLYPGMSDINKIKNFADIFQGH